MTMTEISGSPYSESYASYWDAGWRGIIPLPYMKKWPPPEGYTGYEAADVSWADCHTWAEDGTRNIALRLPDTAIGIDVDHYDGKSGGDTLAALVRKFGALPASFLSTSREDGISGIRVYRVPSGTTLPTKLPGIEFIQYYHRYVVAWPSMHPNGGQYKWINEQDGSIGDGVPNLEDIPMLPARWIEGLAVEGKQAAHKTDVTQVESYELLVSMPHGDPCSHVLKAAGRAMLGGDRHDSYNEAVLAVLGAGRRGCPGAFTVIGRLRAAFVSEIADPKTGRATPSQAEAEWQRSLRGAISIVAGESQGDACPDDVDEWIRGLDGASAKAKEDPDEPAHDAEPEEPSGYQKLVRAKYADLRINEDARSMLAEAKAGSAHPLHGLDLAEFLAQPDEGERYRVDGLWPAEGRVLLAAAAKSGKTTTVVGNLIPSLVDGRPFLGQHDVQPVDGRVVLLNMEVGERTLRNWMRRAMIAASAKVTIVNLRGRASALTLNSEQGRARFAEFLSRIEAEVVILDPLAPVLATLGLDENSNADVATFFSWWGDALGQAGVVDDLVVHHTGHAGQRSRGASRLLDEPDAIWTLTKGTGTDPSEDEPLGVAEPRFLSAYGRDVEVGEQGLDFDPATGALILNGRSKAQAKAQGKADQVVDILADQRPRSMNQICQAIGGDRNRAYTVVNRMIADGSLFPVGRTSNGHPTYVLDTSK